MQIESVVIPMYKRTTLCISSQVGAAWDACFARTGKMGLLRNLSTEEIVGQVFAARYHLGFNIRNVVFMGMGEPLDNFDNVTQAIRVMEDQRGLDIARRYITVSTVGLTEGIDRLARIDGNPVNLAVSLNAPTDEISSRLMPVNRRFHGGPETISGKYPLIKKIVSFYRICVDPDVNDQRKMPWHLGQYLLLESQSEL
jgi:23S rRNA (adenine2503-C2)-methyltransferase